jgi:hypothetical protein
MRTAFQHSLTYRNQSLAKGSKPTQATSSLPKGLEADGYGTSSQMLFMKSSTSKTTLKVGETATMTVKLPKTGEMNIPNQAEGKMYDVSYRYDTKNAKAKVANGSNLEVVRTKIDDDGTATVVVRATKDGASVGPTRSGFGYVDSPVYMEQSGSAVKAVEVKAKAQPNRSYNQDELLF